MRASLKALSLVSMLAASLSLAQEPPQRQMQFQRRVNQRIQMNMNNAFGVEQQNNAFGVEQQLDEPIAPQLAMPPRAAFDGRLTSRAVARSIEEGVLFLQSQQTPDGSVGGGYYAPGGSTALAALAWLAAGKSPSADQSLARALNYLLTLDSDNTYVRAIRANVWEYALRKAPYDERMRKALEVDYEWLLKAKNAEGWRYGSTSTDWDNSCTQYGVLGVWAASRAGLNVPDTLWASLSSHFRRVQEPDGGWSYTQGGSSTNMATAGLASLFLVFDMYHAKEVFRTGQPDPFAKGEAAEVLAALDRGMKWLSAQEGGKDNSYYLYGIERAGVASGRKYFGGEDWFAEGARVVLARQLGDGSLNLGYEPTISTAFSILFMVYGGAPVVVDKLQHGEGSDWNLNPRDIANLTKHLWEVYERPVGWHIVGIDDPVEEYEAPILFISGTKAFNPTDAQVASLRTYVERGGTLLTEASDGAPAFAKSIERLATRLDPSATLKPLGTDHPVYRVLPGDWSAKPALRGAGDGSRTWLFLSDGYLSADWQRSKVESDAFKLATHLLLYVTDLGELPGRFADVRPDTPAVEPRPIQATVGQWVRPGAKILSMASWEKTGAYLTHTTGLPLAPVKAVTPGKDNLAGLTLLHLTGRGALDLSPEEEAAVVAYVKGGGTLLIDAWGGDAAFARDARVFIQRAFGTLAVLPSESDLAQGRFEGGQDLSRQIAFKLPARRWLRTLGRAPKGQQLEVVAMGERPAVLFSPLDLSAAMGDVAVFESSGYQPDSARRVVSNVLAYALRE